MGWRDEAEAIRQNTPEDGGWREGIVQEVSAPTGWRSDPAVAQYNADREAADLEEAFNEQQRKAKSERYKIDRANQLAAESEVAGLESDYKAFIEEDFGRVKDMRSIVRLMPRFLESGDQDLVDEAQRVLETFKDKPEFRDVLNTELGDKWLDNHIAKEPDRGFVGDQIEGVKKTGRVIANTPMNILERFGDLGEGASTFMGLMLLDDKNRQADGLRALGRMADAIDIGDHIKDPGDMSGYDLTPEEATKLTGGDGFVAPFDWQAWGEPLGDQVRKDPKMVQNLNPLALIPKLGGPDIPLSGRKLDIAGVADLGTQAAVDPLTWTTAGVGTVAKGGMLSLSEHSAAGAALATVIRTEGFDSLDEASKVFAREVWAEAAATSVKGAPRATTGVKGLFAKFAKDEEARIAKIMGDVEKNVARRGQGGVHFMGMRIPGTQLLSTAGYKTLNKTGFLNKTITTLLDRKGNVIKYKGADFLDILPENEVRSWLTDATFAKIPGTKAAHRMFGGEVWEASLVLRSTQELLSKGNIAIHQALQMTDQIVARARTTVGDEFADALQKQVSEHIRPQSARSGGIKVAGRKVVPGGRDLDLVLRKIRPRADIAADETRRVADAVGDVTVPEAGRASRAASDTALRLSRLTKLTRKEMGDDAASALNRSLVDAVSVPYKGRRRTALQRIVDAQAPDSAASRLAAATLDINNTNTRLAALVKEKMPRRFMTQKAKNQLRHASSNNESPSAFLNRVMRGDEVLDGKSSVFDFNDAATRILGGADVKIGDVYETAIERVMAAQSAEMAKLTADYNIVTGLEAVSRSDGMPLVRRLSDNLQQNTPARALRSVVEPVEEEVVAATRQAFMDEGLVEVMKIGNESWWAPPAIRSQLDSTRQILSSAEDLRLASQLGKDVATLWASGVTSSLFNPSALAFNARNALGNVMFAFMGGLRNVDRFREAGVMQVAAHAARNEVKNTGKALEEVIASLPRRQAVILRDAMDHGVIDSSFFAMMGADVSATQAATQRFLSLTGTNAGRKLSSAIENNARLALYIDAVEKGMTPAHAAAHVKKYLLDYADLTPLEHTKIRMVSRFYTFMRKNLPLQIMAMVTTPGRVANVERGRRLYEAAVFGDEDRSGDSLMPSYLDRAGYTKRGDVFAMAESPFTAIGGQLDAGFSALSLFPGSDKLMEELGFATYEHETDAWQNLLGLFSGPLPDAVSTVLEGATGRSSFTGGPLKNDNASRFFRFSDTVVPPLSRIWDLGERVGVVDAGRVKEDQRGHMRDRLLSMVTGVKVTLDNEGFQDRQLGYLRRAMEDLLDTAVDEGMDVPTLEELREAGAIQNANRVFAAVMYATPDPETGETVQEAQVRRLRELLPERVAGIVGVPVEGRPSQARTEADTLSRAEEIRLALEGLGVTPNDEQVTALLHALPGAPSSDLLADLGIQTDTENIFNRMEESPLDKAARESRELSSATRIAQGIADIYGMSLDTARSISPVLTEAQQAVADAEEAGLSQAELQDYLMYELLSRQDRAWLGLSTLEDGITYNRYSDVEKDAQRAYERRTEIGVVNSVLGLGMTQEYMTLYTYWGLFSGVQQDALGIFRQPSVSRRTDLRSLADKAEDYTSKLRAVDSGLLRAVNAGN